MANLGRYLFYITIFVCGMSTMGVELTASRLLAPLFGTSLFVWTNIIGIVLISLSIGYYLGGRYADKHPDLQIFYIFSLTAGLLIGAIPFLYSLIMPFATQALSNVTYSDFLLSFIASVILFAFPTAFLGAIVPYAVRLNAKDVDNIGSKSGNIYAISTIGSIFGVYLPALLLIPSMGTRFTIVSFSLSLIIVSFFGLITSIPRNYFKKIFVLIIIIPIIVTIPLTVPQSISSNKKVILEGESPYNYLQVRKEGNSLYLLGKEYGGIWSKFTPRRVFTGSYWDYHLVTAAFANEPKNVLILGLGAGTTARGFSAIFPNASIDGVEIDSLVIKIGKKYFDMNYHNLNTIISDGRFYVKITKNKYDIIVVDVYRDAYIPYHMTTLEFFKEIKAILNDGGVISLNIIDFPETKIVDIIGNTLSQIFSKVYILQVPSSTNNILFATDAYYALNDIRDLILEKRNNLNFSSSILEDDILTLKVVFTGASINIKEFHSTVDFVLTDDKAPIENIIGMNAFFPK